MISDKFVEQFEDSGNGKYVNLYNDLKNGKKDSIELVDRGKIFAMGKNRVVIEKISIDEVYLLDSDFKKIKRICGGTKTDGTKDPCEHIAGLYTSHQGFGYCINHHKHPKKIFDRFIKQKQKDGDLLSFYNAAKKIPDEEIEDLYPQARLLLAFINMFRHYVEDRIKEHKKLIEEREGRTLILDIDGNFVMELSPFWKQDEIAFFTYLQKEYKNMVTAGYKLKRGIFVTTKMLEGMFDKLIDGAKELFGEERAQQLHTYYVQNILFLSQSVMDGSNNMDMLNENNMKALEKDSRFVR